MKREELRNDLVSKTGELEEEVGGMDMLKSYMLDNTRSDNKDDWDNKFFRDTMVIFMLAGRDNFLGPNREEIESLMLEDEEDYMFLGMKDNSSDDLPSRCAMRILKAIPSGTASTQVSHQADVLPTGHHVNPEVKILSHLYAMGRMTSIWGKDCFEFKPWRWISERDIVKHEPSYKFFTFNSGTRTCLGKEVAFTVMKIIAAAIIFNYDVRVSGGQQVIPTNSIIPGMKHGLKAKIASMLVGSDDDVVFFEEGIVFFSYYCY